MTRLLDQAPKPEQFVSHGKLKVAFYDAKNPDYNPKFHDKNSSEFKEVFKDFPEYVTYIYILNGEDDRSIVQRAVGNGRVPDGMGGTKPAPEILIFKKAHDIYLKLKNESDPEKLEIDRLKAEIAALKGKKESAEDEKLEKAISAAAPKKPSQKKKVEEAEVALSE